MVEQVRGVERFTTSSILNNIVPSLMVLKYPNNFKAIEDGS